MIEIFVIKLHLTYIDRHDKGLIFMIYICIC